MTVGQRIKKRREECGLSVVELAAMLDKARSTVYRYESDEIQDMPITVLEPLAEALETTPAYLMGWTDDPVDHDNDDLSDVRLDLVEYFDGDSRQIRAFLKAEEEDQQKDEDEITGVANEDIKIRMIARDMKSLEPQDLDAVKDVVASLKRAAERARAKIDGDS